MRKILIIGATSAIARCCAQIWAIEQAEFFLVGRNKAKLQQTADDLIARGAKAVKIYAADLNDFTLHQSIVNSAWKTLKEIDIALIAHGTLPDQDQCQKDSKLLQEAFFSNGLSAMNLLTFLANKMETQTHGTIAVISSVAGDRGRQSNYIYGSAKAALSTFCQGLRARLCKVGINVLTIKPGFVDTPMTQDLSLPNILVSSPEKVAKDINNAILKKKSVIYTPSFWWIIMFIIKTIPEIIFKKLKL
jgi:short-subunit dehydrogenase